MTNCKTELSSETSNVLVKVNYSCSPTHFLPLGDTHPLDAQTRKIIRKKGNTAAMPSPKLSDWVKKSQIFQFRAHFCRNCKFLFLYIKWGPRCTYWPFSEFFRTLEHPERCKIVVLLNAWFETILGDETNLLAAVGKKRALGLESLQNIQVFKVWDLFSYCKQTRRKILHWNCFQSATWRKLLMFKTTNNSHYTFIQGGR